MSIIPINQNPALIEKEDFSWSKKNINITLVIITSIALTAIMALSTLGFITIAIPLAAKITIGLIGISVSFIATLFLLNKKTDEMNRPSQIVTDSPNLISNNPSNQIPNNPSNLILNDFDNLTLNDYHNLSLINNSDYDYDNYSNKYHNLFSDDYDNQIHIRNEQKAQENSNTTSTQNNASDNQQKNISSYIKEARRILEASEKIQQEEITSWNSLARQVKIGKEPFSKLTKSESNFLPSAHITLNALRALYNLPQIDEESLDEESLDEESSYLN